jgi:acetate kinase
MRILVLNSGSSTLKAALVVDGERDGDEVTLQWPAGQEGAAEVLADALARLLDGADAVGYRVVHGGDVLRAASIVDERLLHTVEALDVLAPLHNRRAASLMRAAITVLPDTPHVACFDTAFHATLPEVEWRYPLPAGWVDRLRIRRYGFHGLSVAWAVRAAAALLERPGPELRLLVAHLGSGSSVTAVDGGRSVATSMGYTPYEGLMMGTRAGSVDPGILLRLAAEGVTVGELADGLAQRSGLLAIAGTADVRDIERRAAGGDAAAQLAVAMFARRAAAGIAAAATALPSVDGLVFTGGIGANAGSVREAIVGRLRSLGVPSRLSSADADGVLADGPPAVLAVEAREELVIADEVAALLA